MTGLVIGSVVAAFLALIFVYATAGGSRACDIVLAEVHRTFSRPGLTPYQAARYTGTTSAEVALWLLLERELVLISRDGRILATHVDSPAPAADPVQAAVLGALGRSSNSLKLHEILADPAYLAASDQARELGVPDLHVIEEDNRHARKARKSLREHGLRILDARFSALGHEAERAAVGIYRDRAPAYVPSAAARRGSRSGSSYDGYSGATCATDGGGCGSGGCGS